MSEFHIAIRRDDGTIARLKPGSRGELNMVAAIVDRAAAKGIGLFRTEKQMRAAITDAVIEVLRELKNEVEPTA